MIDKEEIRPMLISLQSRLQLLKKTLHLDQKRRDLEAEESKMSADGFWNDQAEANKSMQLVKNLKILIHPWDRIQTEISESLEMLELALMEADRDVLEELALTTEKLETRVDDLDIKSLLKGRYDSSDIFFSIHAGAGGTESCDWASMMLRMYLRFFERNGYEVTTLSVLPGEEAGIRNVQLSVTGPFAYGYLRSEMGVHRLVRISPFDSNKRRHTSFVSVDVTPDLDEVPDVEINPKDIRVDTYRASGAGGQHVNKTDSAVRITHEATNIVVQCQSERSQTQNKATCMKMLAAKLWQHEELKRQQELLQVGGDKSSIAWGSQIRSYVLQPYQLVKDTRTGYEVGNVQAVLDGEILHFMKQYLQWQAETS